MKRRYELGLQRENGWIRMAEEREFWIRKNWKEDKKENREKIGLQRRNKDFLVLSFWKTKTVSENKGFFFLRIR